MPNLLRVKLISVRQLQHAGSIPYVVVSARGVQLQPVEIGDKPLLNYIILPHCHTAPLPHCHTAKLPNFQTATLTRRPSRQLV